MTMAEYAIARWENPSLIRMSGEPKFQIRSPHQIDFPFSFELLGTYKGMYIYVLDAKQVIQNLDRFDMEFNLSHLRYPIS
jgi:hypothetical protein